MIDMSKARALELINSDSDDESLYFDTDEESVHQDFAEAFPRDKLRPMHIRSSLGGRPFVIDDESNAEILDSFSWSLSGFLQVLGLERVRPYLTLRNLMYAMALLALKVGAFVVFGWLVFGGSKSGQSDSDQPVSSSPEVAQYFSERPWTGSFQRTSSLRALIRDTSLKAKQTSALQSIPVTWEHKFDTLDFIIGKPKENKVFQRTDDAFVINGKRDPLSIDAVERDLVVHRFAIPGNTESQDLFPYSLVLNKFNTVKDHALLVSDEFIPQYAPITAIEFALWYWAIRETDSVGFYNSNSIAGASQLHKHLQLIPKDVIFGMRGTDAVWPLPVDDLVLPSVESKAWLAVPLNARAPSEKNVHKIPQLPFEHAIAIIENGTGKNLSLNDFDLKQFAAYLEKIYRLLLKSVGIDESDLVHCSQHASKDPSCRDNGERFLRNSYNLVVTESYMMIIPRSIPNAESNVNAMGFLGLLLARKDETLLRTVGPLAVLQAVTKPVDS